MFFIPFLYQRRLCADQRFMPAGLNRKPFARRSILEEAVVVALSGYFTASNHPARMTL